MKTLRDLFEKHEGLVANKFPHHLDVYERLFRPIRECMPGATILEIGVGNGGSLQLWREYFGKKATIIGVDVQDVGYLASAAEATIIIGDQGERKFWREWRPQLGQPHVIIDDGSHVCGHQILTFEELFPILADFGYYIVEDIHTSYREQYNAGGSFVEYLKSLADDIHASELGKSRQWPSVFSVSIYPNLAVIQKRPAGSWGGATMRPA